MEYSLLKKGCLFAFIWLISPLCLIAQEDSMKSDIERTFMPQFQMGYVLHETAELSGGIMTQTSIEYRDVTNFIFRVNYDVFNSSMNIQYPTSDSTIFTGKTTFSELIGGIGYRFQHKKHNVTAYVQSGIRLYGYPEFQFENNQVFLDFDRRNLGVMRYTLGYEYALAPKLFLSVEAFSSHVYKNVDFWEDNIWAYGATIGITAPLF